VLRVHPSHWVCPQHEICAATAAILTLCGTGKHSREAPTINVLPDDVLLEIFDLCRWDHLIDYENYDRMSPVWEWRLMAHVCLRWRQIIFASPLRLDLQIICTHGAPVRKRLGIWPTFPIVIRYGGIGRKFADEDNVLAALEHPSRVCEIKLYDITGPQLERITTLMQESFQALASLHLWSECADVPVLPGDFLGGSAPRLQELVLFRIPFPALPTLLSTSSDLVRLKLLEIPQTGYISPEAMVAALATLTRLRTLHIGFQLPSSRPGKIPLSLTRTVLPALTSFQFHGIPEYLDHFAARIDAPLLEKIDTIL
jgi:hypothetical protein